MRALVRATQPLVRFEPAVASLTWMPEWGEWPERGERGGVAGVGRARRIGTQREGPPAALREKSSAQALNWRSER